MDSPRPSVSTSSARGVRSGRRRGFTLLEMLVATAIFGLMITAVFQIVSINLEAATAMEVATRREREVTGFESMVREWVGGWRDPQRTQLQGLPHQFGRLPSDELSFVARTGNGLLSAAGDGGDYTVTLFHKSAHGAGEVGLRRAPEGTAPGASRDWVPVLTEVEGFEVRYFDPVDKEWIKEWNGRNDLPRLIRFRVWLADRSPSYEFVVSIPPRGQTL